VRFLKIAAEIADGIGLVYAAAGSLLKIAEHIARVKLLPLSGGGSFLFYSCPVRHIIRQEDFKDGRDKDGGKKF
jgi:hypothetical protein